MLFRSEQFVNNTLKIVSEKVAYKESLEMDISSNYLEYKNLLNEVNGLRESIKKITNEIEQESIKYNNLKENNNELNDLLLLLNKKIERFTYELDTKVDSLLNLQESLENQQLDLKNKLKRIREEKEEERIKLKNDIENIELIYYDANDQLEKLDGEITKSKRVENKRLKMINNNSSILSSLTLRRKSPSQRSASKSFKTNVDQRSKSIHRVHKTQSKFS